MKQKDPGASMMRFRKAKRFLRNPLGVFAAAILLALVLISVLAPLISPHDPNAISLPDALLGPSFSHPLGTDTSGRDVLSRLIWGGQVTFQAGLILIITGILCGVPTALFAGYFSKWFDGTASWIMNLLMSLPQILILLVVVATLGAGLWPTMIALGILVSPDLFRVTRGVVLGVGEELYIDSAKVSGLSDIRIMFRHILPVVLGPVLIRASFVFGVGIIVQAGLEFLGVGSTDRPSWGGMLSSAVATIYRAPQLIYAPGIAIAITVISLVLLGTAIADTLGTEKLLRPGKVEPTEPIKTTSAAAAAEESEANVAGHDTGDRILQVNDLRISYPGKSGEAVVKGVSLHVNRGEVLGLVGESGSGKSQTSFGILGLLAPEALVEASRISLGGIDLESLSEKEYQKVRGSRMAYVPQEPMSNLDPSFTVGSQLIEPMRFKLGISKAEARSRAHSLLERVGLQNPARIMAVYPHQLSGGMAQRVLLAGAVSCEPELLIADEPTTALDVTVQAEVLNLLRELQRERNLAMIFVTHDLGVVADICDRVAVMRNGEIVEQQEVHDLFADPQHEYTKELLAATLENVEPRSRRTEAVQRDEKVTEE